MKKLQMMLMIGITMAFAAVNAFAATTQTQNTNVTIASVLSIEFASTSTTTFGSGTISWVNVDPTSSLIYPTGGHVAGKADTAVICKYNGAGNWALKMKFESSNLTYRKLRFYMAQPTYNGVATNGTLVDWTPYFGADWYPVPLIDATVYTSGTMDRTNVPNGTFVGISYGLNPQDLTAGVSYSATIIYTVVGGL
ncbi:MAG: hypothetical protein Q8N91_02730 [Candidatus Omnitrophota bacterium]|nr:hypothetical protein [Candidatus Omnitrophota bacterium]